MDEFEKQELETTSRFNRDPHKFHKRTLQFLVISVSLLSFVVSYSSGISHLFHYKFHFSTLIFPLFTYTLERRYMFLICNGIVAVLVKNLSFTSSSLSGSDLTPEFTMTNDDGVKPALSEIEPYEDEAATMESDMEAQGKITPIREKEEEEEEEETRENGSSSIQAEERESRALITWSEVEDEDGDGDEEEPEESGPLIPPLAEDEGNEMSVNAEELNRKFEEFIRKMKEEIMNEAQQQLIAV